jgi:hypothetical protein
MSRHVGLGDYRLASKHANARLPLSIRASLRIDPTGSRVSHRHHAASASSVEAPRRRVMSAKPHERQRSFIPLAIDSCARVNLMDGTESGAAPAGAAMYTLLRTASPSALIWTHAPALVIAFVIAELYFKWKSFALECLGFLAVWFVLDLIFTTLRTAWMKRKEPTTVASD